MEQNTRRFNKSDRAALFLAAGGKCSICKVALEPGYHADHVQPFSLGGVTDVVNGQALCPTCNLRKAAIPPVNLRQWQQYALDKYYGDKAQNWTLCATPGAGKTTFAAELAMRLLRDQTVGRVTIVVPTSSLKEQWADAAERVGLRLQPVDNGQGAKEGRDFHGSILTYQQLAEQPSLQRMHTSNVSTLVIFDEIHHAGDQRDWGDKVREAFEHATRRLLLTGTPWRSDNNAIPWANYDDNGRVIVDFDYGYGAAVRDGVCRPISFRAYDGTVRWVELGSTVEIELGDNLQDDDVPEVLRSILDPKMDWMPAVITEAHNELTELRTTVSKAAGLIIADGVREAREYAKILRNVTGQEPVVVVSEDVDAHKRLDQFRSSDQQWLVAVRMVSEGVDIPRLAVGVYASRTRTPLFFRQVVGRFVRQQEHDEHGAALYIPAIPALKQHASQIEQELRHTLEALLDETKNDDLVRTQRDRQWPLFEPTVIAADNATLQEVIYQGQNFSAEEIAIAEGHCRKQNIPLSFANRIAAVIREQNAVSYSQPAPVVRIPTPTHRLQQQLTTAVNTKVGKVANLKAQLEGFNRAESRDYAVLNRTLNDRFGIAKNQRSQAAIETLQQMILYLDSLLEKYAQ